MKYCPNSKENRENLMEDYRGSENTRLEIASEDVKTKDSKKIHKCLQVSAVTIVL